MLHTAFQHGLTRLTVRLLNEADSAIVAGRFIEARTLFSRAVELDSGARSANAYGCFLLEIGHIGEAAALLNDAVDRARQTQDLSMLAVAANNLACVHRALGRPAVAMAWQQQALRASVPAHETSQAEENFAAALQNRGNDALMGGDYELAQMLFQRALSLAEMSQNQIDLADSHGSLGILAGLRGDLSEARLCLRQAYRLHGGAEHGNLPSVRDLLNLAEIRRGQGCWRGVERLLQLALRRLRNHDASGIAEQVRSRLTEALQVQRRLLHDPRKN